jgi:hypothetical protein
LNITWNWKWRCSQVVQRFDGQFGGMRVVLRRWGGGCPWPGGYGGLSVVEVCWCLSSEGALPPLMVATFFLFLKAFGVGIVGLLPLSIYLSI